MAALEELIQQISDEQLRQKISAEVTSLKRRTKFGLVFENHTPECLALYDVPIRKNSVIAKKFSALKEFYKVVELKDNIANCIDKDGQHFEFALSEIVTVARFGDSIYPYLEPLDSISRAPDSDLWHILIEAENYHALQLLKYVCEDRKVDCIYIDPPYNTGARDWKYNNEYVDASDGYRHSKWLSMMERRLKLAKDILSDSGAIFISVDDGEVCNLKLLCDRIFGPHKFVAQIPWRKRVAKSDVPFGLSQDYESILCYANKNFRAGRRIERKYYETADFPNRLWRYATLTKQTSAAERPNSYFTIINPKNGKEYPASALRTWAITKDTFQQYYDENRIIFPGDYEFLKIAKPVMRYWQEDDIKKSGADFGIVAASTKLPDEVGMTQDGTKELAQIFNDKRFAFPKPVQLIKHLISIATTRKPDALILDFFAGSGTTMHAVNLLNAEDGGNRRCILVTNNEVSEAESKALKKAGHQPGDEAWNKLGIARYVTWPRNVCAIKGENLNGEPLSGKYLGSDIEMAEGFKANAAFFKLDFLNKDAVELGREFKRLLPLLWLKAGGYGECPKVDSEPLPTMMILPKNKLAFLLDESFFYEFKHEIYSTPEIKTVFIISDTHDGFNAMAADLPNQKVIQLYKNYLVDFRLFIKG